MEQKQKDVIINTVNDIGLIETINLFAGDKDIIRNAYIDNPESYLDYLIGNTNNSYSEIMDRMCFVYSNDIRHTIVFECRRPDYEFSLSGELTVDDFIWRFFYVNVMKFSDNEIQKTIKSWLTKHIPKLSQLTPICRIDYMSSGSTIYYYATL
jgi:hypothetical protein